MNLMLKNIVTRPIIIQTKEICRRQKELLAMPFTVYHPIISLKLFTGIFLFSFIHITKQLVLKHVFFFLFQLFFPTICHCYWQNHKILLRAQ
jgi:hypothetical protein